ncbi:MAG: hypothetical protein AAF915_03080 [Cyanobacteria bacterium P01_D01_bin.50]
MSSQPSNKLSPIKRFALGVLGGLFFTSILWLYSIYFHATISLAQGIFGCSLIAICCGILAMVGEIDNFFDNFPSI